MSNTLPTADMLATYHIGSDSYAGRITKVSKSGAFVMFKATNLPEERFNRNSSGTYQTRGGRGGYLQLGVAKDYRDLSF